MAGEQSLSINYDKTQVILFKTKSHTYPSDIVINNHSYRVWAVAHLLGLTVDEGVSWNLHIDNVCNSLSKCIFAMQRMRDLVDESVLCVIYYGYCYSNMRYGASVFGVRVMVCQEYL